MANRAGGVPARPPILILNRINLPPVNHFLPETSGTFTRIDPDVLFRKCLPNVGNHRRTMTLVSHRRVNHNHIVNFDPIVLNEHHASTVGHPSNVVPSIALSSREKAWNTVERCGFSLTHFFYYSIFDF